MRVRPIAFAGVHRCAAARHLGGRDAGVEAMLMAELQSRPGGRVIPEAGDCAIGVNAESAK